MLLLLFLSFPSLNATLNTPSLLPSQGLCTGCFLVSFFLRYIYDSHLHFLQIFTPKTLSLWGFPWFSHLKSHPSHPLVHVPTLFLPLCLSPFGSQYTFVDPHLCANDYSRRLRGSVKWNSQKSLSSWSFHIFYSFILLLNHLPSTRIKALW